MDHINWLQPSLGWSSGPTALKLACDQGFKEIYILGFDYQGHAEGNKNNRFRFNNVFKDTRNYKKSNDEATFYGNWMNQTKRCLQDYKDIKLLQRYISERGKIMPRRITYVSLMKQRELAKAIKRARFMALMPYVKSDD